MKITPEIKDELLKIKKPEEYMVFQKKYPDLRWDQYDTDMRKKFCEIIRMAPGSRGDGTGNHEELKKKLALS